MFQRRSDNLYYLLVAITTIIRLLPFHFLIGIYNPTVLGWIWMVFLAPITCLAFVLLVRRDIMEKNWIPLKQKTILSLIVAIALTMHWYFVIEI